MDTKHSAWEITNRIEFVWSLVERLGIWVGSAVMLAAGPTGHAIGGLVALYYVIPLSGLGLALIVVGFKRRSREGHGKAEIDAIFQQRAAVLASRIRREFIDEKIDIVALGSLYSGKIRDMTFVRCEFFGPVVLCGGGGRLTINAPNIYADFDIDQFFVEMPNKVKRPSGMVALKDCSLKDCHFHRVSFALPREQIDEMKSSIANHPQGSRTPPSSPPRSTQDHP